MDQQQPQTPSTPETPATISIGQLDSVAEYREARDKGLTEIPNPAAAKPVEQKAEPPAAESSAEQVEADANSAQPDAAVSEAARQLRKNRADERKKQIQKEIADGIREREQIRRELAELQRQRAASSQPEDGKPGTQETASFPSYEQWLEKNADKSYEDYVDARTDHRYEQRQAAERARVERDSVTRAQQEAISAFNQRAESLRQQHADFDALVNDLVPSPAMQAVIFGTEEGPAIALHLARNKEVYERIFAMAPERAFFELGVIRAALTSPAKAAEAAAPPVSKAPAPVPSIGGGAATASTKSAAEINSLDEYRANKARLLGGRS